MTKLKIIYSSELEVERLEYTLSKMPWYEEHGYKPYLPSKLSPTDSPPNKKELVDIVHSEYDPSIYEEQKRFLESHWQSVFNKVPPKINELLPFLQPEYTVYLTRYGTGGSYDYPNTIYSNVTYWWQTGIVRNILHEISHLSIHPLIEEYKIDHWNKERLVDLITLNISEEYGRKQTITEDVTMVDDIFDRFYPNTKIIIENVAKGQQLDSSV